MSRITHNTKIRSAMSIKRKLVGFTRGYTTVELLVGLVLSLFIIGLTLTYFMVSARTLKLHTNEAVVQENGRFALEILASAIRHAGINPSNDLDHQMQVFYAGSLCASGEQALGHGEASTSACTKDGANNLVDNNSDRVSVDFVLDASKMPSDMSVSLCNGHRVDVPAGRQRHFASVYWTADIDGDGVRSLYCQGLNLDTNLAEGAASPLIDGVERLQVQYGLDSNGDGIVERYLSFTHLGATNAHRVRSVRFALLVASGLHETEANTEFGGQRKTFKLLDGASETMTNEQVFRQVYATTVMIHNAPSPSFTSAP